MTAPAPKISIDDLAADDRLIETLIDVRGPDEYAAGHVPGARNVPLEDVLADPSRSYLDDDNRCSSSASPAAEACRPPRP